MAEHVVIIPVPSEVGYRDLTPLTRISAGLLAWLNEHDISDWDSELNLTILGDANNFWKFTFGSAREAMLFKLTWGGR